MAWMPDEQWEMVKDSIDKKNIAHSARSRRTHCGKGGAVKFPSDFMTKKELNKMNGEVKSYHMNEPMTFSEFKSMPDDLKVLYIKALRKEYKVPNKTLADVMGIDNSTFSRWLRQLGLGVGKNASGESKLWKKTKDCDRFYAWWNGASQNDISEEHKEEKSAEDTESKTDELIENTATDTSATDTSNEKTVRYSDYCKDQKTPFFEVPIYPIPENGKLTFSCQADRALKIVSEILHNSKVRIRIEWDVLNEED